MLIKLKIYLLYCTNTAFTVQSFRRIKYIDQLKNSSHNVLGFNNSKLITDWSVEYMHEPLPDLIHNIIKWTPLKTGGELRCSGRVNSFCSTSGTHRINLVTNLVISHAYTENMLELFRQCCIFIVFLLEQYW
jgi:UDP-N-acetylglucosamine transferase subunit ALG13